MDDTVYRQDVIDSFDRSIDGVPFDSAQYVLMYTNKMIARVKNLPSAHPQYDEGWRKKHYEASYSQGYIDGYKMCEKRLPRWTPCSEGLPEEKDAGILKKLGIKKRSEYVLATVEVKGERTTVTACTYDGKWDFNMKYAFPGFKIVAWMPMPEPYQGGD